MSAFPNDSSVGLLSDYFSPDQLAVELKVSIRSLERWRTRRLGPVSILIGRKRYYRRADVLDWLAGQTDGSSSPPRRSRVAASVRTRAGVGR